MYSATFTEFLGTTLLLSAVAFTGTPLLIVAALAIAIAFGGKISGGHFNPAVTGWALLAGKISQQKAISYILAQMGAGVFIWILSSMIKV